MKDFLQKQMNDIEKAIESVKAEMMKSEKDTIVIVRVDGSNMGSENFKYLNMDYRVQLIDRDDLKMFDKKFIELIITKEELE